MKILLTFDLEEFDLIKEKEKQLEISRQGLLKITSLLDKYKIQATFFTTALFAKKYPELIRQLDREGHEIACHGYCHLDSYLKNISKIKQAKEELEKLGIKIRGFRAPRFEIKNIHKLADFGFVYDSSSYPTIAPGKYFNLSQKRGVHKLGNVTEIPLSTLPLVPFLRAPINWYMFRHFPKIYNRLHTIINSLFSYYQMLIFHPWEFVNLENFDIPNSIKKNSGENLMKILESYIMFCKKQKYKFMTIINYLNNYPQKSLK